MFKQKRHIIALVVGSLILFNVMPVSASMIDDRAPNKERDNMLIQENTWWQYFHYYFSFDQKKEAPLHTEAYPSVQSDEKEVNQEVKEEVQREISKDSSADQLDAFELEVVELTNVERAKYQLAPLEIDQELSKVAKEKSKDMRVNRYFAHESPVYGSPFNMMEQFGLTYQTAGENIAMGQQSPQEVVDAWMNSEGHRANILNGQFTHIGVGFDANGNYWTQQFIGK